MTNKSNKYNRHSIRLKEYNYNNEGWYFITACINHRKNLLGSVIDANMILNNYGKIVDSIWRKIPKRYSNTEIDDFIIMPNHFHGILHIVRAIHESPLQMPDALNSQERRKMLLPRIVGFFKMNSAKAINRMRGVTGSSVWQRNYYEHIIRDEADLNRIRKYIIENPLRWQDDIYFENETNQF